MGKKTIKASAGIDKQLITPTQAAQIVDGWVMPFFCDDESIGDLMLVLYAIAYNRDIGEREGFLCAIEAVLMPFAPSVTAGLKRLMEERRTLAQKGGA